MVFIDNKKLACATCIKGHRSTSCNHTDRALYLIRAKGRPVSQCDHCRELRKTKQVHVKCECDAKPTASGSGTGAASDAAGTQLIVARKGARKIKTLEPAVATFPNGIQDMMQAAEILRNISDGKGAGSSCNCKQTGNCACCTDRREMKKAEAAKGHKPSISLTIPNSADSSSRPQSPNIMVTPIHSPSRGHSRSPSAHQHHATDGHQIGASQSDHVSRHTALYSPYATEHALYHHFGHNHDDMSGRPPPSPRSSASPIGNSALSPSSTGLPPSSPLHLSVPADFSGDLSAPASPLSVDLERPHSSLSIHDGIIDGRSTPMEYSFMQGGSGMLSVNTDWSTSPMNMNVNGTGLHEGMAAMGLGNSPVLSSPIDQLIAASAQSQQANNRGSLSPTNGFNQSGGLSPISTFPAQYPSPTDSSAQPSPVSFGQLNIQSQFGLPSFQGSDSNLGFMMQAMADKRAQESSNGQLRPYPAVFDDEDTLETDPTTGIFRPRSSSHHSISSAHSAPALSRGPEIRLMSASPIPGSVLRQVSNTTVAASFGGSSCPRTGQGCHCWSATGDPLAERERCGMDDCPCCSHLPGGNNAPRGFGGGEFGMNVLGGTSSNYATSTEREVENSLSAEMAMSMLGSSGTDNSLLIPPYVSRSRSSSSSSVHSQVSAASILSSGAIGDTMGGASLGRANSTGGIGRNARLRPILPKPILPGFGGHRTKPSSLPGSSVPSGATTPQNVMQYPQSATDQQFTFPPRPASANPPTSPSISITPALSGGLGHDTLAQFMSSMDNNSNVTSPASPHDHFQFSNSQSSFMNLQQHQPRSPVSPGGASPTTSSPVLPNPPQFNATDIPSISITSHGRSHSYANVSSFLEAPKSVGYTHQRSTSASSFLDGLNKPPSIEFIVTPASPFGAGGSSST
ncbi:hypothetical protein FRB99_001039 [Tulasnella sp. 403]|nr:hypothetical protein FRB99_001039 [Tulasnella sp. 403]